MFVTSCFIFHVGFFAAGEEMGLFWQEADVSVSPQKVRGGDQDTNKPRHLLCNEAQPLLKHNAGPEKGSRVMAADSPDQSV